VFIEKPKVPRAEHGLEACPHTEMSAQLEKVLLDGPPGEPQNPSNIGGALTLLDPRQALNLARRDQANGTRDAWRTTFA